MRFPMALSPLWRPLLLPLGGTPGRSYAEIEDGQLHVRFGLLFDQRFPLDEIDAAAPSHWPVWAGIGWRTSFRGTVGLIGTYVNVVEVRFKQRQRVRMLLSLPCQRLFVSLEEPRDFIAALQDATAARAPREPSATSAPARRRRRKKTG